MPFWKGIVKGGLVWGAGSLLLAGCHSGSSSVLEKERSVLPVLGKAPAYFQLLNQDSVMVNSAMLQGKVWVADFFFTTCPTICPRMSDQMARLRDTFAHETRVVLLSHSIDPEHDRPFVLRAYAGRLGGTGEGRWHLLTGEKDSIYALAEAYSINVTEDAKAPGGFIHSGAFVLVDQQGRIRGFYDGTRESDVDRLIADIRELLVSGEAL